MKRAVVTGIGIISALGIGRETNWAKMRSGKSGISEIASFDAAGYRGVSGGEAREFAGTTIRKARKARLDRASHLLIHAAREAMVHANISETIGKERVFVSVGTTLGGMLSGEVFHREFLKKGPARTRISILSDYLAHSQAISLFRELELRGDFVIFSDACASGTNAVGNGFRAIRQGRYTTAICGGYDTMSEYTFAGFNSLMAVTPTLCRPFDKERNGLVLGEGAGVLILEELEHALERRAEILCEIIGYGASSDAHHITAPDPSGRSAARAMQEALVEAGSPRVDHINAHGTGTKYNDPMEASAISQVFGTAGSRIPVTSIKPMIGHLLGGAGAVEAIAGILALIDKVLPPTINYETPDPECNLLIVREACECDVKTVLSNSFGFGGSNASILMREYPWEK